MTLQYRMATLPEEYTYVFIDKKAWPVSGYQNAIFTSNFSAFKYDELARISLYPVLFLYLLHNKQVIGYVQASIKPDNHIYLSFVEIYEKYHGKKLCEPMLCQFIKESEKAVQNILYFNLSNVGGIRSGRCYINAFSKMGYSAFTNHTKSTAIRMENMCSKNTSKNNDCDIDMYFFKNSSGGYRAKQTLKRSHKRSYKRSHKRSHKHSKIKKAY